MLDQMYDILDIMIKLQGSLALVIDYLFVMTKVI